MIAVSYHQLYIQPFNYNRAGLEQSQPFMIDHHNNWSGHLGLGSDAKALLLPDTGIRHRPRVKRKIKASGQ